MDERDMERIVRATVAELTPLVRQTVRQELQPLARAVQSLDATGRNLAAGALTEEARARLAQTR